MEISVRFEEMKKGEDQRHEAFTHASVLRLELRQLGWRAPEEDIPNGITCNHDRKLRGNMQSVPYAAEIVKVDFRRGG